MAHSRTPRWVRGLKYKFVHTDYTGLMSHPTMGAWIEIDDIVACNSLNRRRTPRWVRGLK